MRKELERFSLDHFDDFYAAGKAFEVVIPDLDSIVDRLVRKTKDVVGEGGRGEEHIFDLQVPLSSKHREALLAMGFRDALKLDGLESCPINQDASDEKARAHLMRVRLLLRAYSDQIRSSPVQEFFPEV